MCIGNRSSASIIDPDDSLGAGWATLSQRKPKSPPGGPLSEIPDTEDASAHQAAEMERQHQLTMAGYRSTFLTGPRGPGGPSLAAQTAQLVPGPGPRQVPSRTPDDVIYQPSPPRAGDPDFQPIPSPRSEPSGRNRDPGNARKSGPNRTPASGIRNPNWWEWT